MLLKRLAGMEFTAVGMNFVDKRGNDLRISILVDSVAKVKDMSSVSDMTEIFNNLTGLLSHDIFAGKQHRRIQVALERNFILSQCTNLSETDCPVETHRIGTDL